MSSAENAGSTGMAWPEEAGEVLPGEGTLLPDDEADDMVMPFAGELIAVALEEEGRLPVEDTADSKRRRRALTSSRNLTPVNSCRRWNSSPVV